MLLDRLEERRGSVGVGLAGVLVDLAREERVHLAAVAQADGDVGGLLAEVVAVAPDLVLGCGEDADVARDLAVGVLAGADADGGRLDVGAESSLANTGGR